MNDCKFCEATGETECVCIKPVKLEPHSDVREMAATQRQMYEAYLEVGFTPQQAIVLIGHWIRGAM